MTVSRSDRLAQIRAYYHAHREEILARKRERWAADRPRADAPIPEFSRPLEAKRYVVTAAQNATPVHAGFLAALRRYADAREAQILVVPHRHRNPTSIAPPSDDDVWAPELVPYLYSARGRINRHLVLAGDVRVQPTAANPLAGFEGLTGPESCVIAHPRVAFRAVASPLGRLPKVLATTGAVTRDNYGQSKAGALGAFHHSIGALVVEIDGGTFHLRQILAGRDGSFVDLDRMYLPDRIRKVARSAALVLGDSHARFVDPAVDAATFGPGGIVEALNPEVIVFHDVTDGHTHSPHHHALHRIANARAGRADVAEEIREAVAYVRDRSRGCKAVIVPSNHHDFLVRWILSTDWRADPANAVTYLECALALAKSSHVGPRGVTWADPLAVAMEGVARVLRHGESFAVRGVELGMHGHLGPGGARGTLRNLSRLGARVVTGHSHTPGIEGGHYQVGTSTPLSLEYTHGPGAWLNTHCVVYPTGKRTLLTIVDGKWRSQ